MGFLDIQINKYILVDVYLLNTRHFVHTVRIYKGLGTLYQCMLESMDIRHHSCIQVLRKWCMDLLRHAVEMRPTPFAVSDRSGDIEDNLDDLGPGRC